ncbi:hypothetical protein [Candidatus Endomicrobiellum trichonymphae]|uniref:hypothetical protein n=1 Tax=Endomicrobium trichonymphae TaxID=1408204 RepID=UPI0003229909|nr:hypothetical protein [Candidatus Endomicrobium trichonymphae]
MIYIFTVDENTHITAEKTAEIFQNSKEDILSPKDIYQKGDGYSVDIFKDKNYL